MKTIVEYINESLRLNEAKYIDLGEVFKDLNQIQKWTNAENIKNLISEYMSAGDAEDLDKKHWDACVDVIEKIGDTIADLHSGSTEKIDASVLTNEIIGMIEADNEKFIKTLNKKDKNCDWDIDECLNLFNTVSMKVCKTAWLI